jgi:hypothetical protein
MFFQRSVMPYSKQSTGGTGEPARHLKSGAIPAFPQASKGLPAMKLQRHS